MSVDSFVDEHITSDLKKSINSSLSNDPRIREFHNNEMSQKDLEFFGFAKGNNYYVSDFCNNPIDRKVKEDKAKKSFKELVEKDDKDLSYTEKQIKDGFLSFRKGELPKYLQECSAVQDNSAESPVSLGGPAYLMPTLAKMLGETFTMETSLGTYCNVSGKKKQYLINDYLTAKTNTSFEYAQYLAYILETKPTIFTSYGEIKKLLSDRPGSMQPFNGLNNYDGQQEARTVKNKSFSMSVQYNEMEVKALQSFQGINQIAWRQQMVQRTFDELYYYNGIYDLFNNPAFQLEQASRGGTQTLAANDLMKMSGIVDATGALKINFSDIVDKACSGATNDVIKFVNAFKTWSEARYGNGTMKEPILVLPLLVFNKWHTTPLQNSNNLNRFFGMNNFKDYFEYCTGIEVAPLNLIDELFASSFGNLSLSTSNAELAFFYDKSQFYYITTKVFSQYNTYGTANNVDFTSIFEGEFCPVFNPYYNVDMTTQRIPALKFVLSEGTTSTTNIAKVLNESKEEKKISKK